MPLLDNCITNLYEPGNIGSARRAADQNSSGDDLHAG